MHSRISLSIRRHFLISINCVNRYILIRIRVNVSNILIHVFLFNVYWVNVLFFMIWFFLYFFRHERNRIISNVNNEKNFSTKKLSTSIELRIKSNKFVNEKTNWIYKSNVLFFLIFWKNSHIVDWVFCSKWLWMKCRNYNINEYERNC